MLEQVNCREIAARIAAGEICQLLDVREPEELAIANLESLGFRNYPLSQYGEWQQRILAELDAHTPTYVICHHGMRSAQMGQWLIQHGFTAVYNIAGGIEDWALTLGASLARY